MIDLFDRAVDHQRDQSRLVRFVDASGADEGAVAQDRHAVAEFENLLEPVADIDDGDAIRLEPPDQLEQRRRFLPGEVGGRLIENEEFGAPPLGAGGGDELLLADRQGREDRGRRQREPKVVQQLLPVADHPLVVEEPAAHLFVAKKDIGRDAEVRAKHDLLVDRVDAETDRLVRRRQRNRRAAP